jgi:predicted nucleotidyltransferase
MLSPSLQEVRPMNVTVEDYDRALEGFIDDVRTMEDNAESLLLFGSMARGEVNPGQSDMMDAYIVLRPEVFEDKARFLASLEIMLKSCDRLGSTGIPFHPFAYINSDEVEYLPARAFSLFPFEPLTKAVWGTNLLPRIKDTPTNHVLNRTRFFEARTIVHFQLAPYLYKEVLTKQECQEIIPVLLAVRKNTYMAYMALTNRSPNKLSPVEELEEMLPGLDTSVLKRIVVLKEHLSSMPDVEEVRLLVRDAIIFIEDLHSHILARLNSGHAEEN